jgi:hypothetical protein
MTNKMTNNQFPKYDLEERTAKFGESIIDFAKKCEVTKNWVFKNWEFYLKFGFRI